MNDRRDSSRLTKPIEIEFWCDATHHRGRIEDLSEGGFYVYTVLDWPVGQSLEFSFPLHDESDEPIRGTGTLVWTEYLGFGVRFESIDDDAKRRIRALLETAPSCDRRGQSLDERLAAAG